MGWSCVNKEKRKSLYKGKIEEQSDIQAGTCKGEVVHANGMGSFCTTSQQFGHCIRISSGWLRKAPKIFKVWFWQAMNCGSAAPQARQNRSSSRNHTTILGSIQASSRATLKTFLKACTSTYSQCCTSNAIPHLIVANNSTDMRWLWPLKIYRWLTAVCAGCRHVYAEHLARN